MPPVPPPPPPRSRRPSSGSDPLRPILTEPGDNASLPWLCLGLALTLLLAVIFGFVWFAGSGPPSPAPPLSVRSQVPSPNNARSPDFLDHNREPVPANVAAEEPEGVLIVAATTPQPEVSESQAQPTPTTAVEFNFGQSSPKEEPAATSAPPVFDDLRRRQFVLALPSRGKTDDKAETKLADIPTATDEPLQLRLLAEEESGIKLSPQAEATSAGGVWLVEKSARSGFGARQLKDIGRFIHRDGELHFEWNPMAPAWVKPGSLQFSPLELQVGAHRQVCRLWKPIVATPVRINVQQTVTSVDLPIASELLDPAPRFRVQFDLANIAEAVVRPAPVGVGERAIIVIGDSPEHSVELELTLAAEASRCSLRMALFAHHPVKSRDEIRLNREEITLTSVASVQNRLSKKKPKASKKAMLNDALNKKQEQLTALDKQNADLSRQINLANSSTRARYEVQLQQGEYTAQRLRKEISQMEVLAVGTGEPAVSDEELHAQQTEWCAAVLEILTALQNDAELRYAITAAGQPPVPVAITEGAKR